MKKRLMRLITRGIARLLPRRLFLGDNFDVWQAAGLHVVPNHFYGPIPDTRRLPETLWDWRRRKLAFDMNAASQLMRLSDFESLLPEWRELLEVVNPINGKALREADSFKSGDREVLYGMVRRFKPARIIEIGSGATTAISARALERNRIEGYPGELIAVEPYPVEGLRRGFPGLSRLEITTAQQILPERIEELRANDILFIDSSHVYKAGSDVQHIFSVLLPAIPRGVLVHFHDIFSPSDYPREWLCKHRLFWNEQYVFEAFMSFNAEFEVLWGGAFMALSQPEMMRKTIPWIEPLPHLPASFWIRRR